jgi:hypothetical protein
METGSQTVEQSQYLTFFIGEEEYAAPESAEASA